MPTIELLALAAICGASLVPATLLLHFWRIGIRDENGKPTVAFAATSVFAIVLGMVGCLYLLAGIAGRLHLITL